MDKIDQIADELAIFHAFGLPGMSLSTEVPEPAPLVNRCGDCGRRISANKIACKACWDRFQAAQEKAVRDRLSPVSPVSAELVTSGDIGSASDGPLPGASSAPAEDLGASTGLIASS